MVSSRTLQSHYCFRNITNGSIFPFLLPLFAPHFGPEVFLCSLLRKQGAVLLSPLLFGVFFCFRTRLSEQTAELMV